MPFQFRVLRVQGIYYLTSGLWPLFHMASFEAITGPKVEDWLVRMVGLLAAVIGMTLLVAVRRRNRGIEILVLAIGSALAFAAVDIRYALGGVISPLYLADAVVELGLVVLLVGTARSGR
ncbi:MAG TPA: hypothetical protein VFS94_00010 [Gemmatimonadales bacterium]|nr:hypothetical protein [Gemmatimonadales bacterium]